MRLTPRDTSFYELFADLGRLVERGARELTTVLGAADARERGAIAARMDEIETEGDAATQAIIQRARASFVTPFDREDIYRLATALDECLDHMDAAVDLIDLYQIEDLPKRVTRQVEVLARMAELTADAMPRLHSMRELSTFWIEVSRLEGQADKAYRRLLAKLYNTAGADPITVMKNKEVIDQLEAAADAFERVANLVEGLAVKES